MKKIHDFDSWLAEGKYGEMSKEEISYLRRFAKGKRTYDKRTGLVDLDGDFDCSGTLITFDRWNPKIYDDDLKKVKISGTTGRFVCSNNLLTSLEGAPQIVGGDFICARNRLTTLKGSPRKVGGGFWCIRNDLKTLEGIPDEIGGSFSCLQNQLTTLEGAPQKVSGDFNCSHNQLTTLEGAPQIVGGNFDCGNNKISSLEGAPQEVGGNFRCSRNQLTTLEGAPKIVGGDFECEGNNLSSLKGAPRTVEGRVRIGGDWMGRVIDLKVGEWNPQGWFKIWKGGSEKTKALIATLPAFQDFMKEHPEEFEGLSDLQDLGF